MTYNDIKKDTLLNKTKIISQLCKNEEQVNKKHVETLMDVLQYFFENYNDSFLTCGVWEIVDNIILFEAAIEEKKALVDAKTCSKFFEFIFAKLIEYTNFKNEDMIYSFSFICLRRYLCSLINTIIHFSSSQVRRELESLFTKELIDLTIRLFSLVKEENDLEIKRNIVELLWRLIRKIDVASFDIKVFKTSKASIIKMKNFKMTKFEEVCLNWLLEEKYLDNESIIQNGVFKICVPSQSIQKKFFLCYLGKYSIIIYFDNEEEKGSYRMEIPYYHIISLDFKDNNIFTMKCKTIAEHTNIFCLWNDFIKSIFDLEIVTQFTVSLEIAKCTKEVKEQLNLLLKNLKNRLKQNNNESTLEQKKQPTEVLLKEESASSENSLSNEEIIASEVITKNKKIINPYSTRLIKNRNKRIDTARGKDDTKKKNHTIVKDIVETNKDYCKEIESLNKIKKYFEDDSAMGDADLNLDIYSPQSEKKSYGTDSDTELILEKIMSCHKKKKEQFQKHINDSFNAAMNEINEKIESLSKKQKEQREQFIAKYEKKKKELTAKIMKDLNTKTKEIKVLKESAKKINISKTTENNLLDQGKSITSMDDFLHEIENLVQKVKDNLNKMNIDINEKNASYTKRKKLCHKAIYEAYQ